MSLTSLKLHAQRAKTTDELPKFEKALAELEALVAQLETGEQSLDASLTEFKRGVELSRQCQEILERARQSVEQLLDQDDESSATPLDPDG